jgi:hypothetical protein
MGKNDMIRYKLKGFTISKRKFKKYDAILQLKTDQNKTKKVSFGDSRYEQYKDLLGYYSSKDHFDKKRRQSYRKRHFGEQNNKYSAGWFSWYYLWPNDNQKMKSHELLSS